jgi:hypothetical protein
MSDTSARVGLGFDYIDSNICVAIITNLPAYKHFLFIIFCNKIIFSNGVSIPKSPRATIIPFDA